MCSVLLISTLSSFSFYNCGLKLRLWSLVLMIRSIFSVVYILMYKYIPRQNYSVGEICFTWEKNLSWIEFCLRFYLPSTLVVMLTMWLVTSLQEVGWNTIFIREEYVVQGFKSPTVTSFELIVNCWLSILCPCSNF